MSPKAMPEEPGQVTQLLRQWSGGDEYARDKLLPVVYKELRRLAHYHLERERDEHTLESTALVHELLGSATGEDRTATASIPTTNLGDCSCAI